jgi:malate dehydrogenase (oxaloacetate-decarboxylating)
VWGRLTDKGAKMTMPTGQALLENSILNKGTAFSFEEQRKLKLLGLLPPHHDSMEEQLNRTYKAFSTYKEDINKHVYLRQLQERNEVLFYRLANDHIEEMMPILYTPTVGKACELFSDIYRKPRGLFIAFPMKDHIRDILQNRPNKDVDVIVVTDGGRTLGIGDQGVGAMAIPIGKLSLYTLVGGIRPERTLPILLDCGTNNQDHINNPLYLGWRHERIDGKDFDDFIHAFVEAVKEELPTTCLQWEDFESTHARPVLEKYRDELLTFNDDVQGTAAVALGAVFSALQVRGETLRDQDAIVFLGAGSAGIGVADYIRAALVRQGLTEEEARRKFYIVDKEGLLTESRTDLASEQKVYAQPKQVAAGFNKTDGKITLTDVLDKVKCGVLIGLSAVANAFTEDIVKKIHKRVERPIIFPLSNPTSHSEADPRAILKWTNGQAFVASGSPYPPMERNGKKVPITQCNNVYIFPAVGLALVATKATRVTDSMLIAAAEVLGTLSPAKSGDADAPLLPRVKDLRSAARDIALAVALQAEKDGVCPVRGEDVMKHEIAKAQWYPEYPTY